MEPKDILDIAVNIFPIIVAVALMIYVIFLSVTYIADPPRLRTFKKAVESNPKANVGLPVSAVSAFAVVSAFWPLMPRHGEGELELEVFSLTFTGSSGPITLWVLCFLAFVVAMKTVSS